MGGERQYPHLHLLPLTSHGQILSTHQRCVFSKSPAFGKEDTGQLCPWAWCFTFCACFPIGKMGDNANTNLLGLVGSVIKNSAARRRGSTTQRSSLFCAASPLPLGLVSLSRKQEPSVYQLFTYCFLALNPFSALCTSGSRGSSCSQHLLLAGLPPSSLSASSSSKTFERCPCLKFPV